MDHLDILVLLVEDSHEIQTGMAAMLKDSGATIIAAMTTEEAKRLFLKSSRRFDLIVVDGCVDTHRTEEPDTIELIQWFRDQGYTGLMVAWASNPHHRQQQLKAGCNVELEKFCLPRYVEHAFCTPITPIPPPPC